ncbi:MAG: DNA internalization-related competence protein ComEC/Rec2 [Candidatus Gastranaerophilales bacterium]|nr:DNA internalization-related competence protein ComEC/Rec2 [Candidatus Gastranaerophilales bacterium]
MELEKHIKTIIFSSVAIFAVSGAILGLIPLFAVLLTLALLFGFYKKYLSLRFSIVLVLAFLLMTVYTFLRIPRPDEFLSYAYQTKTIYGRVANLPDFSASGKKRFYFNIDNVENNDGSRETLKAKTMVLLDGDVDVRRGDYLRLDVEVKKPFEVHNPGQFDYGEYLKNQGIFTISIAKSFQKIPEKITFWQKIIQLADKVRENIIQKHLQILSPGQTEVLGGIVFGSEAIKPSAQIKQDFINSGLYHLLAASGMNVAFIFGVWYFIFSKLKVPFRLTIISGAFVVFVYALMTGFPPSVTRATWMLELGLLGKLLDRAAPNNTILFLVCMLLLIYDPMLITDIGFLLSFLVTFGIMNCAEPLMNLFPVKPWISGWFVVPFVAQVWAAPVQMYCFNTFNIYSILANMLVLPFMAIMSFCGFISSIFIWMSKAGYFIGFLLDKVNEPFINLIIFVAEFISKLPNATIYIAKPNLLEIIIFYSIIILFTILIKNEFKNMRQKIITFILVIFLSVSFAVKAFADDLRVTFLSVGEADSILIETPQNKTILVDAGRNEGKNYNSGKSVIVPFLKNSGINTLDMLILTHPDSDHIGGAVDVLKSVNVKQVITNGESAKSKTYYTMMDYFNSKNIKPVQILNPVQEIKLDDSIRIIAIKPPDTIPNSQNDTSIILFIVYKDFDLLLMGDNEKNSYKCLKENVGKKVEAFKVGHHGSKNALNYQMAQMVNPDVSVISVGKNSYGHPCPIVMNYLKYGRIFRTDYDNSIRISTDGKTFHVYNFDNESKQWKKQIHQKPCSK